MGKAKRGRKYLHRVLHELQRETSAAEAAMNKTAGVRNSPEGRRWIQLANISNTLWHLYCILEGSAGGVQIMEKDSRSEGQS